MRVKKYWKSIAVLGVVAITCMAPILILSRDPIVTQRLQETSAFTSQTEINESNTLIQHFGSTRIAKLVFHRYWFYGKTFTINLLSHFRPDFLFLSGDNNTRHSIHFFGLLFPTDLVLLISGLIAILYRWRHRYHVLWLWLIIALIPAAMTKATPHALRTLPAMPVYMLMIGIGATNVFQLITKQPFSKILKGLIVAIFALQVVMFWHFYLFVYPSESSKEWQYGYEQMVKSIATHSKPDEKTYITTEYKRPAMYYWFFTKTDPKLVQAENDKVAKDQGEFKSFRNLDFVFNLSGEERGIIASTPEQRKHFSNAKDLEVVNDLRGQPLWIIYRVE